MRDTRFAGLTMGSGNSVFGSIVLAGLLGTGNVAADDLTGARHMLCSVLETHVCVEADSCAQVLPEELNIPLFIRIDAQSGTLSTTPASGENRETAADSVSRADGQLTLQGVENGRAFSLFIQESTGLATFASAAAGRSFTVFGACTPSTDK
jgi:hypothetical protein